MQTRDPLGAINVRSVTYQTHLKSLRTPAPSRTIKLSTDVGSHMIKTQMISSPTVQLSLQSIINDIFSRRCISRTTQQQLMQALFDRNELSEQEATQINRMFDAINRGQIRVTD